MATNEIPTPGIPGDRLARAAVSLYAAKEEKEKCAVAAGQRMSLWSENKGGA